MIDTTLFSYGSSETTGMFFQTFGVCVGDYPNIDDPTIKVTLFSLYEITTYKGYKRIKTPSNIGRGLIHEKTQIKTIPLLSYLLGNVTYVEKLIESKSVSDVVYGEGYTIETYQRQTGYRLFSKYFSFLLKKKNVYKVVKEGDYELPDFSFMLEEWRNDQVTPSNTVIIKEAYKIKSLIDGFFNE